MSVSDDEEFGRVFIMHDIGNSLFFVAWWLELDYRVACSGCTYDLLAVWGKSFAVSLERFYLMLHLSLQGDQPTNVLQIAAQHDCGFELLQVRTGPAKSIAYQRDMDIVVSGTDEAVRSEIRKVLEMSKGRRGDQQRRNTKALGKVILKSLAKGGSADMDLGRLGELFGLANV